MNERDNETLEKRNVCVLGQGYVGLTLSAVLAQSGFDVVGLEKDDERYEKLTQGVPHFDEPELEKTISTQCELGTLRFGRSTDHPDAGHASAYIIAVGSPLDENKTPNTSIVESAVDSVTEVLESGDLVVLRSTIPVGTSERIVDQIETETGLEVGKTLSLVHAPERTLQGAALRELRHLPQVIGADDRGSVIEAERLFRHVTDTILRVESLRAAELVKLMDNTYRDVTIALGNAFGEIARSHGLDGTRLIEAANKGYDRNQIKSPGLGVGGGCLPKDPYLVLESLPDETEPGLSAATSLIRDARQLNESMPHIATDQLEAALSGLGKEPGELRSLVFGIAFKGEPATNDIRHTPAAPVIDFLAERGPVDGYDPNVEPEKIASLGARPVTDDDATVTDVATRDAYDVIVLANNNPTFKELELASVADAAPPDAVLLDGWNLLDERTVEQMGLSYVAIGGDVTSRRF
ncbi:nucleotide sugar dehydrogenase [Natronorubrum sulfidifaciens]|uniref:UDP-N-acetyl-D-mannosamine dehydrogenase n=1 Tax=Natronorubrum sulfidifaciens JCM 14089 TaxID=1230460 RepID=L9VY50_9EURY|nr:nucleotide sugar dehydrogenase [Natronorubrum sulfidifaciens]ELY42094.1 UDP-glucose 6-dehydrogenase [Natronorubrum sulfidifaciens JCM 14089]